VLAIHLLPQLLFPQAPVHVSPTAKIVPPVARLVDPVLVVKHPESGSGRADRVSFRPRRLVLVVEVSGATHQTMLVYVPSRVQYPQH
jgi:hypothetical protein